MYNAVSSTGASCRCLSRQYPPQGPHAVQCCVALRTIPQRHTCPSMAPIPGPAPTSALSSPHLPLDGGADPLISSREAVPKRHATSIGCSSGSVLFFPRATGVIQGPYLPLDGGAEGVVRCRDPVPQRHAACRQGPAHSAWGAVRHPQVALAWRGRGRGRWQGRG